MTTATGNVYRFRPPAPPQRIGSFGGTTPRGAVVADARTLLAVVDAHRLVALDLPTGVTHVRAGGIALDGPPARARAPGRRASSPAQLGMLLGIDAAGNERAHVAARQAACPRPRPASCCSAPLAQPDLKPSPPVVVDASGRVAFVRASGRAGVVSPEGRVEVASERVCAVPIAVLPAGDKRMLVACHDGGLWMYGE